MRILRPQGYQRVVSHSWRAVAFAAAAFLLAACASADDANETTTTGGEPDQTLVSELEPTTTTSTTTRSTTTTSIAQTTTTQPEPYELPEGIRFEFRGLTQSQENSIVSSVARVNQVFKEIFGVEVEEATIFAMHESHLEELEMAVLDFINEIPDACPPHPRCEAEFVRIRGSPFQALPRAVILRHEDQFFVSESTIAHELFHVLQHQLKNPAARLVSLSPPGWMTEGNARYVQGISVSETTPSDSAVVAQVCVTHDIQLPALEIPLEEAGFAAHYNCGMVATEMLVEIAGERAVTEFWARQGQGEPWPEAFQGAFALSVQEFYAIFEEWRSEECERIASERGFTVCSLVDE